MPPPTDPAMVDHPKLRGLALRAAWVAKLEEAEGALEDLVLDLAADADEDNAEMDVNLDDDDPLAVALSVVQAATRTRAATWRTRSWPGSPGTGSTGPSSACSSSSPGRSGRAGGGRARRAGFGSTRPARPPLTFSRSRPAGGGSSTSHA